MTTVVDLSLFVVLAFWAVVDVVATPIAAVVKRRGERSRAVSPVEVIWVF